MCWLNQTPLRFFFLTLLVGLIGCGENSSSPRHHVVPVNDPVIVSEKESSSSEKMDSFIAMINEGSYVSAFNFLVSSDNLRDLDFVGDKRLKHELVKLMDQASQRGLFKEYGSTLVERINSDCNISLIYCGYGRIFGLDHRLISLAISVQESLRFELRKDLVGFLISVPYNFSDKWDLLVALIKNQDQALFQHSNADEYVVYILETQINRFEGSLKLSAGEVRRYLPQGNQSLYGYAVFVRDHSLVDESVFKAVVNPLVSKEVDLLCESLKTDTVRPHKIERNVCASAEFESLSLVNQAMIIALIQGHSVGGAVVPEELISLVEGYVKDYFILRGFALTEYGLKFVDRYYTRGRSKAQIPDNFVHSLRELIAHEVSPDWSSYLSRISDAFANTSKATGNKEFLIVAGQYNSFFRVAFELPLNLLFALKLSQVYHREIIKMDRGPDFTVDSTTSVAVVFSGKWTLLLDVFNSDSSEKIDTLRVRWAVEAIKNYNLAEAFGFSLGQFARSGFEQSTVFEVSKVDHFLDRFKNMRVQHRGEFVNTCKSIRAGKKKYQIRLSEIKESSHPKFGPGLIKTSYNNVPLFNYAFNIYFSHERHSYVPEMIDMFRTEIAPKLLVLDQILGTERAKTKIEVKYNQLFEMVTEDIELIDSCFPHIWKEELLFLETAFKGELAFAQDIEETLERLNQFSSNSKQVNSIRFYDIIEPIVKRRSWSEFLEDLDSKLGFQQNPDGSYFFRDSPVFMMLRLAHSYRSSELSDRVSLRYGSYNELRGALDDDVANVGERKTFSQGMNGPEFFINEFFEGFKISDAKFGSVKLINILTYIDAALVKARIDLSPDEEKAIFRRALHRITGFSRYGRISDWEEQLGRLVGVYCFSCGVNDQSLIGPRTLYGRPSATSTTGFGEILNPLDMFFNYVAAGKLGWNSQPREYVHVATYLRLQSSRNSNLGSGSEVDLNQFLERENPWSLENEEWLQITLTNLFWQDLLSFGEDLRSEAGFLLKRDMRLMDSLIEFSEDPEAKEALEPYQFTWKHPVQFVESAISVDFINSYRDEIEVFHGRTGNLFR